MIETTLKERERETVVAQTTTLTAELASVLDGEREVVGQSGRTRVIEKRAHETFGLLARDHAAASRRRGHGAVLAQHVELERRALYAVDAQRHASIVYLVVGEATQEAVGQLREAHALLAVDVQREHLETAYEYVRHRRQCRRRRLLFLSSTFIRVHYFNNNIFFQSNFLPLLYFLSTSIPTV